MKIQSLSLTNFRNFSQVDEIVFPQERLLVAAAPNATGKTNFLEAVMFLLRGKSFRASAEDCVRFGEDGFVVRGEVVYGQNETGALSIQYQTRTKRILIKENHGPVSPVLFYSHYPLVLFLPDDTFLFQRGPAYRRNFLNSTLVSFPKYLSSLVQYHRALRQRNAALKKADSAAYLSAWNELLAAHADHIWEQRALFTDFLATHLPAIHASLSGEEMEFGILFEKGVDGSRDFIRVLEDSWEQEKRYQYTLSGPHRDELRITFQGKPVQLVLSRGQMRVLVIALKIASALFIKHVTGERPLLMFDEVLSELDARRQCLLLEHLPDMQVLLTCTALPQELARQDSLAMLDLRSILRSEEYTEPVASSQAVAVS